MKSVFVPAVMILAGMTAAGAGTLVAPDNPAIVYSPYNWAVSRAAAISPNPGAYFRTQFAGRTAVLQFDTATMAGPVSQIWWRVDDGVWSKTEVAPAIPLGIPADAPGNPDVPFHTLEVVFKSMDIVANRWNSTGFWTALKFTGIALDDDAAVKAPAMQPCNLLIYGDSLTEGVRTMGESAVMATDQNDAQQGWAYQLGPMLGCEVGVVGFGGQAFTTSTIGNVPVPSISYGFVYEGQPRSFSPAPTLIISNEGFNDRSSAGGSVTAAATAFFKGLLAATPPSTRVVQLEPLPAITPPGTGAAIKAAVIAIASPRLSWVSTAGVFNAANGADSLQVHPSGSNDQSIIAPHLAALLRPYLRPARRRGPAQR